MKRIRNLFLMVTVLLLVGVESGSATELYSGSTTQGVGTEIKMSLASGTSLLLRNTNGVTIEDTCTGSEIVGKITIPGSSGTPVVSKVSTLTMTGCSHTTDVLTLGELGFFHNTGTTNAKVEYVGTRVTFKSTIFGVSCTLGAGSGISLGTLDGVTSGNATVTVNSGFSSESFLCPDLVFLATYTVTSPTKLNAENS